MGVGLILICNRFFLKVNSTVIHLPAAVTCLEEALAFLVMHCHVVGIRYPDPLKNLFVFLDDIFETESVSNKSRSAQKLYGVLYKKPDE